MSDFEWLYLPAENGGKKLKGITVSRIESELEKNSICTEHVFRRYSTDKKTLEEVYGHLQLDEDPIYVIKYDVPYFNGETSTNPGPCIAHAFSISEEEGQLFLAEERVSGIIPDNVSEEFYLNR